MDNSPPTHGNPTVAAPTGGVPLDEERLRALAPAWEALARTLRRMDDLSLGEVEPANVFLWRSDQP